MQNYCLIDIRIISPDFRSRVYDIKIISKSITW